MANATTANGIGTGNGTSEGTSNGISNGISSGVGYSATIDSPSKRPTFYRANPHMSGKFALEEHVTTDIFNPSFTTPFTEAPAEGPYYKKAHLDDVLFRLGNIEERVKHMDAAGVAVCVVSLTQPGIQGIFDPAEAAETARKVNDQMRKLYRTGPHAHRFLTWGCVAMQDPQAAAKEAERCVKGTRVRWYPHQWLLERGKPRRTGGRVSR